MTRKFRSTEFKDIGNEMNEIIIDYSIVNVLGYNTTWLYSVTVTVRWIEATRRQLKVHCGMHVHSSLVRGC